MNKKALFILGCVLGIFFKSELKAQDGAREFGFYNNLILQNDMIGMPVTMDWGFYIAPLAGFDIDVSLSNPYIGIFTSPLHPYQRALKLYENLEDNEGILANLKIPILGLGFMYSDKLYIGFGLESNTITEIAIPTILLQALFEGNYNGENITIINASDEVSYIQTYATVFLAFSYRWNESLTIGVKPKILTSLGYAEANIDNFESKVSKSEDGSTYLLNVQYDAQLQYSKIGDGQIPLGFALDWGATYTYENIDLYFGMENTPGLSGILSATESELKKYYGKGSYEPYTIENLSFKNIADSLTSKLLDFKDNIQLDTAFRAGRLSSQKLPTIVNTAAKYRLDRRNDFGFQSQIAFYKNRNFYSFTPFYLSNFKNHLQVKFSTHLSNLYRTDFSLDINITYGVQFFLGIQHLIGALKNGLDYNGFQNASIRFGISFGDFSGRSRNIDATKLRRDREFEARKRRNCLNISNQPIQRNWLWKEKIEEDD